MAASREHSLSLNPMENAFKDFSSDTTGLVGTKLGNSGPWMVPFKILSVMSRFNPRWPSAVNIV